ncbi:translin [Lentinula detonsa]|uniref:Translin n=1 Tax=Lentinula detonsa TaxID=2804962 RepID=A0A9W8TZX2_9AGAR|nr:translin [Lentinula detonsa]KAJ3989803.1 translin [Lentinula detonsa]
MDPQDLENLNQMLDHESNIREKIREQVNEFDKKTRTVVGILSKIHSTHSESIPSLIETARPILHSCSETIASLVSLIPPNQFWRWKDMWCNSLRTAVFAAALSEYLTKGSLISLESTSNILGMQEKWKDRVDLAVEDYLHGLITMVNELSRLAVNAVILGDFEQPLKISAFVKELFSGFSVLNLKNDTLRRRFDSLKYDMKKIEEVVYDVSLRKLVSKDSPVKPTSSE